MGQRAKEPVAGSDEVRQREVIGLKLFFARWLCFIFIIFRADLLFTLLSTRQTHLFMICLASLPDCLARVRVPAILRASGAILTFARGRAHF